MIADHRGPIPLSGLIVTIKPKGLSGARTHMCNDRHLVEIARPFNRQLRRMLKYTWELPVMLDRFPFLDVVSDNTLGKVSFMAVGREYPD